MLVLPFWVNRKVWKCKLVLNEKICDRRIQTLLFWVAATRGSPFLGDTKLLVMIISSAACMYVCMYVWMLELNMRTNRWICIDECTFIDTYVSVHVYMYVCMYACMYTWKVEHPLWMNVCMYVCMCTCMLWRTSALASSVCGRCMFISSPSKSALYGVQANS